MSERIPSDPTPAARRRAVAALRGGEAVVMPTDTVYAIVGDAFNRTAIEVMRRAKGRSRRQPFTVVLRSPRQVTGLVSDIPEPADRLMAAYWPGPLTLVFAGSEGLGWDLGDTDGTVGLRMPTDDLLLSVIAEVGPMACTAANRAGSPPPRDVDEAEDALGRAVGLYIDGGRREGAVSTIVDVTSPTVRVLREGAVPTADVEEVAGGALTWGERPARAPGDAPGQRRAPDDSTGQRSGDVPDERGDADTPAGPTPGEDPVDGSTRRREASS